jgi:hypothetical protein
MSLTYTNKCQAASSYLLKARTKHTTHPKGHVFWIGLRPDHRHRLIDINQCTDIANRRNVKFQFYVHLKKKQSTPRS